jgi:hypothetical protein
VLENTSPQPIAGFLKFFVAADDLTAPRLGQTQTAAIAAIICHKPY